MGSPLETGMFVYEVPGEYPTGFLHNTIVVCSVVLHGAWCSRFGVESYALDCHERQYYLERKELL